MTLMAVDQKRIHNIFMNIYQILLASQENYTFVFSKYLWLAFYMTIWIKNIPQITFLESNIDTPKADMK